MSLEWAVIHYCHYHTVINIHYNTVLQAGNETGVITVSLIVVSSQRFYYLVKYFYRSTNVFAGDNFISISEISRAKLAILEFSDFCRPLCTGRMLVWSSMHYQHFIMTNKVKHSSQQPEKANRIFSMGEQMYVYEISEPFMTWQEHVCGVCIFCLIIYIFGCCCLSVNNAHTYIYTHVKRSIHKENTDMMACCMQFKCHRYFVEIC